MKDVIIIGKKEKEQKKSDKLAQIYSLTGKLISLTDEDSIIQKTGEIVENILKYRTFMITINDKENKYSIVRYGKGETTEGYKYDISSQKGIISYVAREGNTYVMENKTSDKRYIKGSSSILAEAEIAIPIKFENRIMGVLNIEMEDKHHFTRNEIHLLETFAHIIAIAITNARLIGSLKSEKEFSENLIESANNLVIATDSNGIVTIFNKRFRELTGLDEKKINSLAKWEKMMPKKDFEIVFKKIKRVLEYGETTINTNVIFDKEGTPMTISWTNSPIKNGSGEIIGVICIGQDVSEKIKLELELKRSEEKFKGIFENAMDCFWLLFPIKDEDGSIVDFISIDANPAYINFINKPKKEVMSKPLLELFPNLKETEFFDSLVEVSNSSKCKTIDKFSYYKDGLNNTLTIEIFRVGNIVAVTLKDITEKIKSNNLVLMQARKLEEKNEEMERFVYSVSHDLKSPLTTVQGMADILLEDYNDVLDVDGKFYLNRIKANIMGMGTLINDLLKLSRVGKMESPKERINVHELVSEIVKNHVSQKLIKNPEIVIGKDLPTIKFERNSLYEIFENLIKNAFLYMGDQKHPKIEIGCNDEEKYWKFYVKDNGIGIKTQYFNKIFKVFERLGNIKTEGTGIGLAIVKRIVENHGGSIWVESKNKGGSTFYFTLLKENGDLNEI
ncbi:MAG: ATP-binding protein [Candidatus Methanofastidiosia archaeon]